MHMRAVLLVLAAVLLAGCGSGSGNQTASSGSNGEASLSANQVLADAEVTAKSASSVHVAGDGFSGKQPIHVDLSIGNTDANGSLSLNGLELDIVRVDGTTYVRGSDAFYKHYAGAAAAAFLHGKWLKVPKSNGLLTQVRPFTNADAFFKEVAAKHGKLVNQGATTYNGQDVVAIHDTTKDATLYVAANGKPYPMAVVSTGGDKRGTITFSDWNKSFSVSAPKDALDLSQLGG
jgi:hypothetical protein